MHSAIQRLHIVIKDILPYEYKTIVLPAQHEQCQHFLNKIHVSRFFPILIFINKHAGVHHLYLVIATGECIASIPNDTMRPVSVRPEFHDSVYVIRIRHPYQSSELGRGDYISCIRITPVRIEIIYAHNCWQEKMPMFDEHTLSAYMYIWSMSILFFTVHLL